MKFSIITPSLNQGRFLRDCIESVRAQTGATVEHIVVDACSTDNTVGILREYPHLRWTSEPDRGQADAINKGFRQASGEWAMWLNADDFLLAGALAAVAEEAVRNPTADVIYGDCDFVDETGCVVSCKRERAFSFWLLVFYGTYIPSTATFFHRRLLDAGFWLDPAYRVNMDLDYYLRLADCRRKFHHLPQVLAAFRWHGTNISLRQQAVAHAEFRQLQRLYLQRRRLGWLAREPFLAGLHAACRGWRFGCRWLAPSPVPQTPRGTNQCGWWRTGPEV